MNGATGGGRYAAPSIVLCVRSLPRFQAGGGDCREGCTTPPRRQSFQSRSGFFNPQTVTGGGSAVSANELPN